MTQISIKEGASQPEEALSIDDLETRIFGICDRLWEHGHCSAHVVLAPADNDGEPDWENTDPANVSGLPGDEWPQDPNQAKRACVILSNIDGCDDKSNFIVMLHHETGIPGMFQIHGPEIDRVVADSIIGRDLGNRPPAKEPTELQKSMATFTAEIQAANDNEPPNKPQDDERLVPYLIAFGAPDALIMGDAVYGAMLGHLRGQIRFVDGKAMFFSGATARIIDLPEKPKTLKIVDPTEWHGQPIPDRDWFLPGLVPARNVTLLSGDGGVGKSLLALQIAAASALGIETMGLSPRRGKVFYLGAEDEEDEFKRRISQIVQGHGRTLADLDGNFRLSPMAGEDATLVLPDKAKNLAPTAMMESLIDQVTSFRPDLLILDTSADLFGGDEINRVQVRQFVGMLRKIAMGIDCAIILLSHPSIQGMQSGSGLSGSTAWNNSVRSRLYLTSVPDDDEARVLTTVKSNYSKKGGGIKMRWCNGSFAVDDGKPSAGAGIVAAKAERLFIELLSLFNRTGQNVSDVTGTSYAPAKMSKHPNSEGIGKRALADAMQRLLDRGEIKIVMEGPPSRQRKRLILTSEDYSAKDDPE